MDKKIDSTNQGVSKANQAIRLFNNPILESFTKSSLIIIIALYLPVVIYFMHQSTTLHSYLSVLLGVLLGLFIWSLAEYLMHRFLFHFKFYNQSLKKIHSIFHLEHHKYIHDTSKYTTLLIASIPSGVFFYFLLKWAFPAYFTPIFTGFALGYVIYECIHYSSHKYKMDTRIGRILKQHHMRHHYFNYEKNFGVTSPLWDYVFMSRINRMDNSDKKFIQ